MAGPVCARPPVPKPRWRAIAGAIAVLAVLACGSALTCAPAHAQQFFSFPPSPPPKPKSAIALSREKPGTQQQMLVKADEIDYDYANHRVAAVGNVQIYYRNSTIEADRVIYDQTNKRLHAEGNVRLTEADGKITYGAIMDLSDDYRDGFVDSLRLDSARSDAHGGRPRRAQQWEHHCLPQRRLYRLRAVQGRSEETAAVAGESRAHHPRPRREDDLFRGRAPRILRTADRLPALFLGAGPDRQAQDRRADADHHVEHDLRTGG